MRAFSVIVILACLIANVASDLNEEETTADEWVVGKPTTIVASERTDIIPAGVAAEKPHEEEVDAEAMRFASATVEGESEGESELAEMAEPTDKKKKIWPVTPYNPSKKNRGCWITQTHCMRHPGHYVGTFRDKWGEKNVGAGQDEAKCLARAQEYHVYCGNPHTVSTTAKFRKTQRQQSYPATGCWIHQSRCNRDSTWTGVFRDSWGEKRLNTANDEERCLQRAREYAVWCGNSQRYSTMAEYRGSGNMRYYPAGKGCFISQDTCVNHPATVSPWPFRDLYGEKNVQAGTKQQNCHARAREYHSWCGNPQHEITRAEFRPSMKRVSYPAVDKVQVGRHYKFQKVSWGDSMNFCKAKGQNLCMRSELCPTGFPLRGRPRGDHWVAVRDMENGWASIGTDFNERICQLHQEIDGGHYGKPSWGFDQYNHPVICCDDPDEVIWAKSLALGESITWRDAKKGCEDEGLVLCPQSVYCPDGELKPPAGGITEGDHWAPTSDYPNSWVSVGDYSAEQRVCRSHDAVTGVEPQWGTQPSTFKFKGHVRCCAKDNACKNTPCKNGAKCIPGVGDAFTCTCKEGYLGKTCEARNKCADSPCQNGAECETVGDAGNYRCHCKAGFSGKDCEDDDPCSTTPCKNGAECKNSKKTPGAYKCICPIGFSGKNCGVRDPCAPNPCKNNATCIKDSDEAHHCKCVPGFNGDNCENNIDDCTPAAIKSCKNGGKCVDGINSYTCDCTGTQRSGPDCTQYPIGKGMAQVVNGVKGELFIDDIERENDLGHNPISFKTYGLPGSTVEINAKADEGKIGAVIASFTFRKGKYSTGTDWECSTDGGKTYRRAKIVKDESLVRPEGMDPNAQFIWSRNKAAREVTCRMRMPMKNLPAGTRVVLPVKNKISPLCSKPTGSVTYYYGEVCANGGVQWNHMHTKGRRAGLTQSQCAWSRAAMKDNAQWLANWLGSCTEPPKMLFPRLPTHRASFYTKLAVEEDSCKAGPCHANAVCKVRPMGPMPYSCKCKKGFNGDGKNCVEIDRCAENPCSSDAWCSKTGPGTYTCACKTGFMGDGKKCEEIDPCKNAVSPCSGRATCTKTGPGQHKCECKPGYQGDGKRCKAINNCRKTPRPCDKHAVCSPTGPGEHRCTCKPGYNGDGTKCTAIDACKKNPCDKNAQCFKTGPNRYRCECTKGYKGNGKTCSEVNMCRSAKPCHKAATCLMTGPGKYSCTCNKGFEGSGKECVEIDMCTKKGSCDDNALCQMTGPGTHSCTCKDGWTGDGKQCTEIDVCQTADNPCSDHAKCFKTGPGTASCRCRRGYEGDGKVCKPIDKCKSNPCDPQATCRVTGPGRYKCKCKQGYKGSGKTCREFDACTEHPCDPHAKCTPTGPGKYQCSCSEGFKGDGYSCMEINDCEVQGLCNENANCMRTGPGTHKCICKKGFRGDGVHCSEINPCGDSSFCSEHASCKHTGPGQAACTCAPGYEGDGKQCTEINSCTTKPCGNHATCTSTGPATYTCSCLRGFRGDGHSCVEIDSCKEQPCPQQSTCMRTGPGRHRCKCDQGYRWSRAAKGCVARNLCKSGRHGCDPKADCSFTGPGTVSCTCQPGYEGDGKKCQPANGCKSNPCGKGEACTPVGAGGFSCACAAGHRRSTENPKDCTPINKCQDAVTKKKTLCGANSVCNYDGPGKYSCKCNAGFKMDDKAQACVIIPVCDSNPCSKFATCKADTKDASQPVCTCLDGFSGDGKACKVKDGYKAVMLAGKLQIVPIRPGDTHDGDLAVIEAMLSKMAADGEQPTVVSAPTQSKTAEPNADDRSKLMDVTKKVASLEETARMMAEQTKAETAALMKLKESAAASKAEFLRAMEATTEKLADKVIDATHEAMLPSKKK